MLEAVLSADTALLRMILSLPHPEWVNRFFLAASFAGIGGAVWIAIAVVLAAARRIRWRDVAVLVAAIALVHVVVDVVLKPAIGRTRPAVPAADLPVWDGRPDTPSFPSGHAANAMAAALLLTRCWPYHGAIVWPAAVSVAVARVYLGAHYPGDAVAGAVTGLACGCLVLYASSRFHPSVRARNRTRPGGG